MDLDFDIDGLTKRIAEFYAQQRARGVAVPQRRTVTLQFPDGLMASACDIAQQRLLEGVEEDVEVEPFICGEAVFGACCVDDVLSKMLGADAIVHFGHSEIVPRSVVCGKDGAFLAVYVPVTSSQWSVADAHAAIAHALPRDQRLAVVSTVQFVRGARQIADMLRADGRSVECPTIPGLSQGEILGCTAPTFAPGTINAIVYVGDGRFHLEAAMMANPHTPTFQYDPFTKHFSREEHDCQAIARRRRDAILAAREAKTVGIAFSTLGRQASKTTLGLIERLVAAAGKESMVVLMDDLSPQALARYRGIDVWVQMACPRLSLDWSTEGYTTPLLTTHEAVVAFSPAERGTDVDYFIPMDNWAHGDSHYRQYV